jgi:hypothetical protein
LEDSGKAEMTIATAHNSGLAKGGVSYSADTFVVKSNALLRTSICGKMPALRQAANRYGQGYDDSANINRQNKK